jgi:hypothetical protein
MEIMNDQAGTIALHDANVCVFCWCRNVDHARLEERRAAEPVDEGGARESVHAYAYAAAARDPKLTSAWGRHLDQNARCVGVLLIR